MTAGLPDDPTYCFYPADDGEDELPQIRILVDGISFAIPTALVALDRVDGLAVCDRLNRKLGLDRAGWTALAARFLRAGGMNGSTVHRPAPDAAAATPAGRGRGGTAPASARGRPGGGGELPRGKPG